MSKNKFKCLHCGAEIVHPDGDLTAQCPRCSFHNVLLLEEDFADFIEINEFDPLFLHKKQKDQGFYQYSWPPITKGEFEIFQEKSPKRAKALLKYLKGEELTESEDSRLRFLKSYYKNLDDKIKYLTIKKKIINLLDKIK